MGMQITLTVNGETVTREVEPNTLLMRPAVAEPGHSQSSGLTVPDEGGIGSDSTHWRTGTCGMTWPTRCAAVCAMRRAPHDGQKPRRLQLDNAHRVSSAVSRTVCPMRSRISSVNSRCATCMREE